MNSDSTSTTKIARLAAATRALLFLATLVYAAAGLLVVAWRYSRWES